MNFTSVLSAVFVLLLYCVPTKGYNDEIPIQKWSPDYLSYRFFPEPIFSAKRKMPSHVQPFTQSIKVGNYRPTWRVGAMGTMYKRVR